MRLTLAPTERRRAVLSARAVWLREMAEDQALPLTRLERTVLRLTADKVTLVAHQLTGQDHADGSGR